MILIFIPSFQNLDNSKGAKQKMSTTKQIPTPKPRPLPNPRPVPSHERTPKNYPPTHTAPNPDHYVPTPPPTRKKI